MRKITIIPDWLRFNPLAVNYLHRLCLYIPFFLPHHKDYYGFRHLATADDGIFLDVGANDGISALGFRQVNDQYHILSIEPNHVHEKSLQAVARRIKRFDYKIVGAGSKRCQTMLYIPKSGSTPIDTLASVNIGFVKYTSKFYAHNKKITYQRQVVQIIPLDKLKLQPDIIKIDTEGCELDALKGLRQTIRTCRPYILIESIPKLLSEEMKFFRSLSYSMFVYDYRTDRFSSFKKNVASEKNDDKKHFGNIFCIPKEKIYRLPIAHTVKLDKFI